MDVPFGEFIDFCLEACFQLCSAFVFPPICTLCYFTDAAKACFNVLSGSNGDTDFILSLGKKCQSKTLVVLWQSLQPCSESLCCSIL